ncbi:GNAT family N-acetyltransferase [Paraglaciecola chathamensis]|uniref:GNAT family N-acetyltransferase n=1 Tax=Paraglaciecola chathamensis TaxID=368405 RepID=UPI0026F58521|nr:GNAT family N-acetyltransferase [Paraglaciecola chathamensis]MDO6558535.1 GNAT family N-acetyltransferase [Paraglaciecola chathamensis]MDO6840620.1 GNAT family N-acetyltransferase [Paraglaciecola chathamensis]
MSQTLSLTLVDTKAQIALCHPLMQQLRPGLTEAQFVEQVMRQQHQGYQLLKGECAGKTRGLAGFWVASKLAWGKHLYVDDLVTDENVRSNGVGAEMLNWLEHYAKDMHCAQIHLDSGVQRFLAHKFYLRAGFIIASHHFTKVL